MRTRDQLLSGASLWFLCLNVSFFFLEGKASASMMVGSFVRETWCSELGTMQGRTPVSCLVIPQPSVDLKDRGKHS